jgi:hypothetical protein
MAVYSSVPAWKQISYQEMTVEGAHAFDFNVVSQCSSASLSRKNRDQLALAWTEGLHRCLLGFGRGERIQSVREGVARYFLNLVGNVSVAIVDHSVGTKRLDEIKVLRRGGGDDAVAGKMRKLYCEHANGRSTGEDQEPWRIISGDFFRIPDQP